MLGHKARKLPKAFPLIVLVSFVWIAFFGVGMDMSTDENGKMSGCPFLASEANFCPMGIAEHIVKWQQTTTVIPRPYADAIFLLFAALAIFSVAKPLQRLKVLLKAKLNILSYRRKELEFRASNPLLVALREGILNPKIYEPAHL